MSKLLTIPVSSFDSYEKVANKLNEIIADKNVKALFFNKKSLTKGSFEIYVDELVKIERPSKFRENATSKYYCVYKDGEKWRYKFVRNNKPYHSKRFNSEIEAALAYDNHVYSVDGNIKKLNFPERVEM